MVTGYYGLWYFCTNMPFGIGTKTLPLRILPRWGSSTFMQLLLKRLFAPNKIKKLFSAV
jgi:hypothetical protein